MSCKDYKSNKTFIDYKFPQHTLPKINGWHSLVKKKIEDDGKIYKYFGYNWWDMLYNNLLPITKKLTISSRKLYSIVLVNTTTSIVNVDNITTGDVYNVITTAIVNSINLSSFTLKSNNDMYACNIGNICLVLVGVEELKSGKCKITNTPLFKDFLLMNGISNKEEYLDAVGIENFQSILIEGWKYIDSEFLIKREFTELLLEHWINCNPASRQKTSQTIPLKIHWIWLSPVLNKTGNELKTRFYKFIDTWIDRNPNFEFNIWTDNKDLIIPPKYCKVLKVNGPTIIDDLINKLPKEIKKDIKYLYFNHPNVGARSDTLRQVILYLVGGIYADINDASCLSPMENLCNKFDFIIGMEPVMYVNNAIMGAKKHHIINKNMLIWLASQSDIFIDEWEDIKKQDQTEKDDYIVSTTGPIALTNIIFGIINKKKLPSTLILPASWIYPNYWVKDSPDKWLKPISLTAHFDARDYLKL